MRYGLYLPHPPPATGGELGPEPAAEYNSGNLTLCHRMSSWINLSEYVALHKTIRYGCTSLGQAMDELYITICR